MSNLKLPAVTNLSSAWGWLDRNKGDHFAYRTSLRFTNGGCAITVRHHSTDIITYEGDGSITLNSGGWWSSTTRNRMDRLTPDWLRVRIRDFTLEVSVNGGPFEQLHDGANFSPVA